MSRAVRRTGGVREPGRTTCAVVLLGALVAGVSCGSGTADEARDYAVPAPLCGVGIDEGISEQILPPGSSVSVDSELEEPGAGYLRAVGGCTVDVDGSGAVHIDVRPSRRGGLAPGAEGYLNPRDPRHRADDAQQVADGPHELLVWRDYAVLHATCVSSPDFEFTGINLAVRLDWLDPFDDYHDELEAFIQPFAEEFLAALPPGTCDLA